MSKRCKPAPTSPANARTKAKPRAGEAKPVKNGLASSGRCPTTGCSGRSAARPAAEPERSADRRASQ